MSHLEDEAWPLPMSHMQTLMSSGSALYLTILTNSNPSSPRHDVATHLTARLTWHSGAHVRDGSHKLAVIIEVKLGDARIMCLSRRLMT